MTKEEIILQCQSSGIGYRFNKGKLAVFDITQLPGAVRGQFDPDGFFIEAVESDASPLPVDESVESVEVTDAPVKRTKKRLK